MSWPSPQDYNEAVQDPFGVFADEELRRGEPALTPLGLPKPITGGFATVYQLKCGARNWAVRCFLKEIKDQQRRYEAINEHLAQARLPFTVGFKFLRDGIRIRGRWYPILKMEWVDGEPLDLYLEKRRSDAVALQSFAAEWVDVLSRLRNAGIAHGDLQHGNVLVAGGKIKLIDYDGMFVPGLAGLQSNEEGHRNYQHPLRTGRDFGPYLDAFPGWVVLLSILALAENPSLWTALNAGEECLLFRERDFRDPAQSVAFAKLAELRQRGVAKFAARIQRCLSLPISQVPPVAGVEIRGRTPSQRRQLPDWLDGHEPPRVPTLPPMAGRVSGVNTAGLTPLWVSEQLEAQRPLLRVPPSQPKAIDRVFFVSTLVCAILIGITIAITVSVWAGVLAASACAAGIFSFLFYRYSLLPEYEVRRAAIAEIRRVAKAAQSIDQQRQVAEAALRRIVEPMLRLQKEYDSLPKSLKNSQSLIEARLARAEATSKAQIDAIDGGERFAATSDSLNARLRKIDAEFNELDRRERTEQADALAGHRKSFVATRSSRARLADARLRGIGELLVRRLEDAGFATAADISTADLLRQVPGIGGFKALTIVEWAEAVKRESLASAPNSLPWGIAGGIAAKYSETRARLNAKRREITHEDASVRAANAAESRCQTQRIMSDLEAARETCEREKVAILAAFDREKNRIL